MATQLQQGNKSTTTEDGNYLQPGLGPSFFPEGYEGHTVHLAVTRTYTCYLMKTEVQAGTTIHSQAIDKSHQIGVT